MARTALTAALVSKTGVQIAFTPSDQVNGNSVQNDGSVLIAVRNGTGQVQTVSFLVCYVVDSDLPVQPRVITVAPGTALLMGPYLTAIYTQQDGSMWIDCSAQMGLLAIRT